MYSCDVLHLTQILIQKLFSVKINIGTVKLIPIDLIKFIFHGTRLEMLPMVLPMVTYFCICIILYFLKNSQGNHDINFEPSECSKFSNIITHFDK